MEDGTLSGAVLDVKVPAEDVIEVRNGKKTHCFQKISPRIRFCWRWTYPIAAGNRSVSQIKKISECGRFCGLCLRSQTAAYQSG